MMRLGAHNSIAGGLHNAVAECVSIGGDTLQMFCKNQRQWTAKPIADADAQTFRQAVAAANVGPVMVHGSYLINMGNPDAAKATAARAALVDELQRTEQLGIPYFNFHPGSHMMEGKAGRDDRAGRDACLDRIAAAVSECIDATKGFGVRLVLENAAGQGTNVGNRWEEIGRILDTVGNDARTGVTVDTQHSWACGYDWVGHYDECWDDFDTHIGLKRLVAFHLNDSKSELGTRVDRHDPIGQGQLGLEFFRKLVNDKRFDGLAGYLETPDGPEGWKKEIALLKSLRGLDEVPRALVKGQARLL